MVKKSEGRGRPKNEIETKSVHVRMTTELLEEIEEYTNDEKFRTKQEAINYLLNKYVPRKKDKEK